ncbi:MAG: alcohol dehydrogenase catalytic domain-containing protein [Candidatus Gastranaerophilales bacterium]|nr:alcohol dehydrogenase catalytic domain-containing protein [Candidatus Gastranaerophilales bacterium]
MKVSLIKNGKLEIAELDRPTLNKKGAIVKVNGCGLCGSDLVKLRTGKAKEGTVLGHEIVGEIVEINSDTNFELGDRIILGHHVPCFDCHYCWGENYSMCKQFKETNILPGGFAEYIFVSELHLLNTAFCPSNHLSDEEASFLEPLGCCVRAVKRSELKPDSNILVIGLGSIGLLMGQAAKALGYKAYGCDLLEERVNLALELGFENAFISQNDEQVEKIIKSKISPIGMDAIFMTSGSDKTLNLALKAIRDGGTLTIFSSIKTDAGFKNNDIYYRELRILGSYSPSPMDLEDSFNFLESGKVKVHNLSTHYKIDDINKAINDTVSNKILKAYIEL